MLQAAETELFAGEKDWVPGLWEAEAFTDQIPAVVVWADRIEVREAAVVCFGLL